MENRSKQPPQQTRWEITCVGGVSTPPTTNKRVFLISVININSLRKTLNTEIIGIPYIEHHPQVTSTNDIAIKLGKTKGAREGTLIITEHQTAGRGRYGRKWVAPPNRCILASVIFTHRLKQDQVHLPNLIGALSIAQGIHTVTGVKARIKHPNDVRIKQKKVAGVLTDIEYDKNSQSFFVLGFGINVNITSDEFPQNLQNTATSLQIATSNLENKEICRLDLLNAVLQNLEENYLSLKLGNISYINEQVKIWEEK